MTEQELSREMSRRARAGMKRAEEKGGFCHAAPLGYANARDAGGLPVLVTDRKAAPLVRESFELVAGGMPVRRALAVMTAKGLRSRRGRPLGPSAFWGILRNPVYAERTKPSGSSAAAGPCPIVPSAVWELAQARLREKRRSPGRRLP